MYLQVCNGDRCAIPYQRPSLRLLVLDSIGVCWPACLLFFPVCTSFSSEAVLRVGEHVITF